MTINLAIIRPQQGLPSELEKVEHLLPTQVLMAGEKTSWNFINYFAASLRNNHTREAYYRNVRRFFDWCDDHPHIQRLQDIRPVHVSAYIELLEKQMSKPSVKQHLAAIRKCLDYMVAKGSVLEMNPASPVTGPKYTVRRGKTKPLTEDQMGDLFEAIDISTLVGMRDRAIIGGMFYTFARVSAVLAMNVEDFYTTGVNWRFRLHEKGGVDHDVPAHHLAAEYVHAYLNAATLWDDKKGPLFRPFVPLSQTEMAESLTDQFGNRLDRLDRRQAWAMVKRRARAAGLPLDMVKNHTFRSTAITVFRKNGGSIADAQAIAAHASSQTTKMYDHSDDPIHLEEIERVRI